MPLEVVLLFEPGFLVVTSPSTTVRSSGILQGSKRPASSSELEQEGLKRVCENSRNRAESTTLRKTCSDCCPGTGVGRKSRPDDRR